MTHFQRELTALKQRVVDMGDLAISMVAGATDAMIESRQDCIPRVLESEPSLDQCQIVIDREAIRLITLFAPVARDLRFLLTIARITTELERIGDEAVDNCKYLTPLAPPAPPLGDMAGMSAIVLDMVRDALRAFREEDIERAKAVIGLDDRVDTMNARVFHELLAHPGADEAARARSTSLILVAHSLERIADHATNICEEVFYLVQGADIRHQVKPLSDTP